MYGEGVIEIDLVDFWKFVHEQHPFIGDVQYGVPRLNVSNGTLEIDVAFSESVHPQDWAVPSKASVQWKELREKEK
jgi:hypothetical protein